MARTPLEQPQGVLNVREAGRAFDLARLAPADDLGFWVSHHWRVRWDRRGLPPYVSEVLTYPAVQLVFERGRSGVFGLVRGKSSRTLEGAGQVLGVQFHAGAFRPLVGFPVARLTDRSLPLDAVWPGVDVRALEDEVLGAADDRASVAAAERFLRPRLPAPDDTVAQVKRVVARIAEEPELTRVESLGEACGLSQRTLQRLFHQYVGAGPKWVLCRYRLQEAAAQLARGRPLNLAHLAASLGYFDQAHFVRDFKRVVGKAPGEYARGG